MNPEKDEYFEVVLYEPTNGAKIGNINRVLITISNDDGRYLYVAYSNRNKGPIFMLSNMALCRFQLGYAQINGDDRSEFRRAQSAHGNVGRTI
jgi:hypothetical protein